MWKKNARKVHFMGSGEFHLRESEWIFCDCDRSSPCFSFSMCNAAARHERLPLIPRSVYGIANVFDAISACVSSGVSLNRIL